MKVTIAYTPEEERKAKLIQRFASGICDGNCQIKTNLLEPCDTGGTRHETT